MARPASTYRAATRNAVKANRALPQWRETVAAQANLRAGRFKDHQGHARFDVPEDGKRYPHGLNGARAVARRRKQMGLLPFCTDWPHVESPEAFKAWAGA